jgi:hypothetical protein
MSPSNIPTRKRRRYRRPAERGLGPDGGGWNIAQASRWSGISEARLRAMAKKKLRDDDPELFPCYAFGRRLLIPRQAFMDWFNRSGA